MWWPEQSVAYAIRLLLHRKRRFDVSLENWIPDAPFGWIWINSETCRHSPKCIVFTSRIRATLFHFSPEFYNIRRIPYRLAGECVLRWWHVCTKWKQAATPSVDASLSSKQMQSQDRSQRCKRIGSQNIHTFYFKHAAQSQIVHKHGRCLHTRRHTYAHTHTNQNTYHDRQNDE